MHKILLLHNFINLERNLNPAATGSRKGLNVSMIYKNQWNYVPGGFNTYGISADVQSARISSGVGIMAYRDVEAKTFTNQLCWSIVCIYCPNFKNVNLHIGINGAFVNKSLDRKSINFTDQLDPSRCSARGLVPILYSEK